MGVIVGTLFMGLAPAEFQTTLGFLFFNLLFLGFGGASHVSILGQLCVVRRLPLQLSIFGC